MDISIRPSSACNDDGMVFPPSGHAVRTRTLSTAHAVIKVAHHPVKISLLSVLLLGLTINTAAAQENTQNLSRKGETPSNSTQTNIATSYEASRERLQHAREVLRTTTDDAVEGLQKQLEKAQQQLGALAARLEQGARSAQTQTLAAAHEAEHGIGLRVRHMEGRALLLRAKAKASLAVRAAAANDFGKAEQWLSDATQLLRRARVALADDHAYDDQLDDMEVALNEASLAVKDHAKAALTKIQKVVTDSDRIVGSLEVHEQENAVIKPK
jgi:hypothetical protein